MKFGLVDNVSVGVRKGMARGRVWLKGLGLVAALGLLAGRAVVMRSVRETLP